MIRAPTPDHLESHSGISKGRSRKVPALLLFVAMFMQPKPLALGTGEPRRPFERACDPGSRGVRLISSASEAEARWFESSLPDQFPQPSGSLTIENNLHAELSCRLSPRNLLAGV